MRGQATAAGEGWQQRGHTAHTLQLSRHSLLLLHVSPRRMVLTLFSQPGSVDVPSCSLSALAAAAPTSPPTPLPGAAFPAPAVAQLCFHYFQPLQMKTALPKAAATPGYHRKAFLVLAQVIPANISHNKYHQDGNLPYNSEV